MVAKREKSCQSPCFNVHVELDNRALKAKNNGLTQTVAKLQQENAELSKQITLLQGESFEIRSRYNNLKNVISIIDSTTKTCLPKLNEVVETFTGIIQLCSVAANISNSNRDTRTQAVKPQIVNGHVLHNPTITLSRLDNDDASYTFPRPSTSRISSNITMRPSTSREANEVNRDRNSNLNGNQDEDNENDNQDENESNGDMVEDTSFICQATRGVCKRKKSNANVPLFQQDDSEDSDEEFEMPLAEEEEENEEDQCDQRLKTIQEGEEEDEDEEEEEDANLSSSPKSRHRRFLKGRLQEVRIYLNQLPTTSTEQFRGSGNISISLAPPERRSSYKQRSSSLVGELNGSLLDNSCSFLDENVSLSSTVKMNQESFKERSSLDHSRSKLSVTFKSPSSAKSPSYQESSCNSSNDGTLQFSNNLSPIRSLPAASTSTSIANSASEMPSLTLQEFSMMSFDDAHRKTSTPMMPRISNENVDRSDILNKSSKSETSLTFKTNVTKRRVTSREKKKVAQVLLNKLFKDKRLSGSPLSPFENIVQSPLITSPSEMRTRSKGRTETKTDETSSMTFEQESVKQEPIKIAKTSTKRKKDSKQITKIKEPLVKPKVKTPPKKSPIGRPKRAARPTSLKEPSLYKKMRRSK